MAGIRKGEFYMIKTFLVAMAAFMLVCIFMDLLRYKKADKNADTEMKKFWYDSIFFDLLGFVIFFILGIISYSI